MDFTTLLLIAAVFFFVGFLVWRYVQNMPEEEASSPYSISVLAEAKKSDIEAKQKALDEKKELEQNWRFGIRMLYFMEHLNSAEEKVEGWSMITIPDPYSEELENFCSVSQLDFQGEEGPYSLRLYEKHFCPEWLKRIDEGAFFRRVEVINEKGEEVFRARLRFLNQEGEDTFTGTILEVFELGSWVPAIRVLLTQSEEERGVDYKKL